MRTRVIVLLLIGISVFADANAVSDEVSTPKRINGFSIGTRVAKKMFSNIHYKIIGVCVWWEAWHEPVTVPELEHFLPDLVVTVYKRPQTNPWQEIHTFYHNKWMQKLQEGVYKMSVGYKPSYGASTSTLRRVNSHYKRPLVDVVGNPFVSLGFPYVSLRPETSAYQWYYMALQDLPISRTLLVENLLLLGRLSDPSGLISGYPVGSATNHWGFELPRHFVINNPNNFKASVVAAMQAADMVTNTNWGHVVNALENSCGKNCVVSNVVYDPKGENIKWQEVYPTNRMVNPGNEDNKLGIEDDKKGNGNYVFVVWRKYRGCVQGKGKLIFKTKNVGNPKKR